MNEMVEAIMQLHRCEDCAIRCKASKKPKSIFAQIHRWHMKWWPGWRMYQEELRTRKSNAAAAPASD